MNWKKSLIVRRQQVSYQVEFDDPAIQEIKQLPATIRPIAREAFRALQSNPRPSRSKELRGKPGIYRIWLAGDWRIIYATNEERQVIIVLHVRLKDDIDYESLGAEE
jgi:mRNA-degrading endonuclease RelE of RelBE toxin-antitoxin system